MAALPIAFAARRARPRKNVPARGQHSETALTCPQLRVYIAPDIPGNEKITGDITCAQGRSTGVACTDGLPAGARGGRMISLAFFKGQEP
ncbi:MAG TPA: hypothetical protein ENK15_08045 [Thermopetrobacter sp.]|nr:hypothetical protein [Thermopetrobacter sp.]